MPSSGRPCFHPLPTRKTIQCQPPAGPRGFLSGHLCGDLTDGVPGGAQRLRPRATDAGCGTARSSVGAAAWTALSGGTPASVWLGVSLCVHVCAHGCQCGRGQAGGPEGEWALLPRGRLGGLYLKRPSPRIPAGVFSWGRGCSASQHPPPTLALEWDPRMSQKPLEGVCPSGAPADCTSLLCRFSAGRTKTVSFPPRLSPE